MARVHSLHTLWLLGASLVLATLLEAAPTPAAPPAPPASSSPPATASVPAVTSTPEERLQVYHEFRQLFDAHNYKDALEPAQRLVTLTEAATGPTDLSLATPLLNLATTQYQLGTFDEAESGVSAHHQDHRGAHRRLHQVTDSAPARAGTDLSRRRRSRIRH